MYIFYYLCTACVNIGNNKISHNAVCCVAGFVFWPRSSLHTAIGHALRITITRLYVQVIFITVIPCPRLRTYIYLSVLHTVDPNVVHEQYKYLLSRFYVFFLCRLS